jgi:archaellum biogenesis ATPase FlaH
MNLVDDIKNNQLLLIVIPKNDYSEMLIEIERGLSENFKKVCYVTLNKPYNSVMSNMEKNNIDLSKFFFIDGMTNTVQTPEPADNCIFVQSPNALTDINLAYSQALEKGCDNTLFDSLSTLLVYEDAHTIIKFAHNIMTKTRVANSKAVFIALKEDVGSELIKDLYMFVDKVVDLGAEA